MRLIEGFVGVSPVRAWLRQTCRANRDGIAALCLVELEDLTRSSPKIGIDTLSCVRFNFEKGDVMVFIR